MRTEFVDDEVVGRLEIAIDTDLGVVSVSGPRIPTATITRAEGAATRRWVPIRSRDPEVLVLRLDGSVVSLRPSPGRVLRRSFRVDAVMGGSTYTLTPHKHNASRFLKSQEPLAVLTAYSETACAEARWMSEATGGEVALAYVLAAAFGVGADNVVTVVFKVVLDSLPPV